MISSERPQPLILVVDCEPNSLDQMAAFLGAAGFACHCCPTAAAAQATAEMILPDLILTDINLHGISGVEMCRQIQRNPLLADVPVMYLSSVQTPDIIRRNDGIHGAYHVRKPLDSPVLVDLIEKVLGRTRLVAAEPNR